MMIHQGTKGRRLSVGSRPGFSMVGWVGLRISRSIFLNSKGQGVYHPPKPIADQFFLKRWALLADFQRKSAFASSRSISL